MLDRSNSNLIRLFGFGLLFNLVSNSTVHFDLVSNLAIHFNLVSKSAIHLECRSKIAHVSQCLDKVVTSGEPIYSYFSRSLSKHVRPSPRAYMLYPENENDDERMHGDGTWASQSTIQELGLLTSDGLTDDDRDKFIPFLLRGRLDSFLDS